MCGLQKNWGLADLIKMLKCNFSAFCQIMNAKYVRRGYKAGKFVLPKTFRSLFFSWASYQKIDFRSNCHWCGITRKCWLPMQQELVYILKTRRWKNLMVVLPKSPQKIKDLIDASFHNPRELLKFIPPKEK